jgi:DNA polymerase III alpha subunit (gram-positive type)
MQGVRALAERYDIQVIDALNGHDLPIAERPKCYVRISQNGKGPMFELFLSGEGEKRVCVGDFDKYGAVPNL